MARKLSKISDSSIGFGTDTDSFLPPNFSSDVNIWNSVNLSGRREAPFYVDEPRFILLNDGENMCTVKINYILGKFPKFNQVN